MRTDSLFFVFLILSLGIACNQGAQNSSNALVEGSEQVLIVRAEDWNLPTGMLYAFERDGSEGAWRSVMKPFPVMLGMNGLAWGVGLDDFRTGKDLKKVEGDKRSPAGIFALTKVFGYLPPDQAMVTYMPYVQVEQDTRCIEDSRSSYYNQIVSETGVKPDWDGADNMLRNDNLYSWGVFVAHNSPEPEPKGGSCIFMHIWRGPGEGTLGCTSMDFNNMQESVY